MKKLLSVLTAFGFVASTGATVVACGNNDALTKSKDEEKQIALKALESQMKAINRDKNLQRELRGDIKTINEALINYPADENLINYFTLMLKWKSQQILIKIDLKNNGEEPINNEGLYGLTRYISWGYELLTEHYWMDDEDGIKTLLGGINEAIVFINDNNDKEVSGDKWISAIKKIEPICNTFAQIQGSNSKEIIDSVFEEELSLNMTFDIKPNEEVSYENMVSQIEKDFYKILNEKFLNKDQQVPVIISVPLLLTVKNKLKNAIEEKSQMDKLDLTINFNYSGSNQRFSKQAFLSINLNYQEESF